MSKPQMYFKEELNEKVPQKIINYMIECTSIKKIGLNIEDIQAIFGSTFLSQAMENIIFLKDKLLYRNSFSVKSINYDDIEKTFSKGENNLVYANLILKSGEKVKINIKTNNDEIIKLLNFISKMIDNIKNEPVQDAQARVLVPEHNEKNNKDLKVGFWDKVKRNNEIRKQEKAERKREEEAKKAEEKAEREREINALESGNLPAIDVSSMVVLHKNEICHFASKAQRLETKNETVGHTAGYSGVSLHIAKGVNYHIGGARGHAIKQDVTHHYNGILFLTNKRVIFVSTEQNGKNFTVLFSKLLSTVRYTDGACFQMENKSYTVVMKDSEFFNAALTGTLKNYSK